MKRILIISTLIVIVAAIYSESNKLFSSPETDVNTIKVATKSLPEIPDEYEVEELTQRDVVMIRNKEDFFPFTTENINGLVVSIGHSSYSFTSMMSNLTATQIISFEDYEKSIKFIKEKSGINQLLVAIHLEDNSRKNIEQQEQNLRTLIEALPKEVKKGIIVFGSPYLLRDIELLDEFEGVVIAYKNINIIQNRTAQMICGALPMTGEFKFNINHRLEKGKGIKSNPLKRLAFVTPEEMGMSSEKMKQLDTFLLKAIADGVFPGCQVAFSYKGKVVYNKSFGNLSYDGVDGEVENTDIYDLASLTKVLASTPALMLLQSQGKFSLDKKLVDYLPELVTGTYDQNIVLKAVMAHQAGFIPYFPFYKKTIKDGQLDSTIYNQQKTETFNLPVAKNIWISEHFRDTMMNEILHKPLERPGHYKYSDVGYYFVQRIIEKLGGKAENEFVRDLIYRKMGLNRIGYLPLTFYPLKKIAPTEDDKLFRKQLIRGYVHDQGAAMAGGVGGHAGLFANATDVLAMLQMYLNKGEYAGHHIIDKKVIEEYTKQQFSGNRRAAGFDRPTSGRGVDTWPISDLASDNSYGHSGFTGTFVWVDPDKQMAFVFLCNRINPDAENGKMVKQRVRIKAHRMVYEFLPK